MGSGVQKETYTKADEKTRVALTYDMLDGLHEKLDKQLCACNERFTKLENNKKRNTFIAGVSGFIGGFLAFFTDKLFKF